LILLSSLKIDTPQAVRVSLVMSELETGYKGGGKMDPLPDTRCRENGKYYPVRGDFMLPLYRVA